MENWRRLESTDVQKEIIIKIDWSKADFIDDAAKQNHAYHLSACRWENDCRQGTNPDILKKGKSHVALRGKKDIRKKKAYHINPVSRPRQGAAFIANSHVIEPPQNEAAQRI